MNEFERRLQVAALHAEASMVSDFEAVDEEHIFSPVFEAKMGMLLRKQKLRPLRRTLQQVACFALVVFLGVSLWLGTDAAALERFIGWVKENVFRDTTHYYFEGMDDTTPVRYEMTKIPEGYEFVKEDDMGEGSFARLYRNVAGKQFDFCVYQSGDSNLFVEGQGKTKTVLVNGVKAKYYYHPDHSERNVLLWVIPETNVLIYLHGFQDESELVEIAESVVPVMSEIENIK